MGTIESKLLHLKLRFKSKLPHPRLPKPKRYGNAVTREDDYCYGDHLGLLDGCYGRSDTSAPCKFPVSSYYYDEDGFESDGERETGRGVRGAGGLDRGEDIPQEITRHNYDPGGQLDGRYV
ncbi:hypothetical protein Daesc_005015 [Daldinia eschscholtzii]|uniref:Uncharacterized protein n=1 Tax=Daldinia eschscholtzii TaxID=292717 RepID=A0AAX6MKK7_9PEZI